MVRPAPRRLLGAIVALLAVLGCREIITSPSGVGSGTPKALRLDVPSVSVNVGGTARVTAQLLDATGQPVAIPSNLTLTYVSSAPSTFSVTNDGLVTGLAEGAGVLRAAVGALQVGVPVTVAASGPRLVPVSGNAQSAAPGSALPQPIRVRALQANGAPASGVTIAFGVTQGSVAPASAATGTNGEATTTWTLGTAVGAQTLVASATGYASTTFTATAAVQPIATITVTPTTATLANVGESQQFTAVARDAANNVVPGAAFVWTTSNAAVATVTSTGLVTAVGAGTTTIAAAVGAISGGAQVTVTLPVPQPRLAFSPPSLVVTASAGAAVVGAVDVIEAGGQAPTTLGTVTCDAPVYTGTPPAAWLTVQACGDSVRVRADAAALPAGNYQATIPVRATLAVNSPLSLAVQFTVSAAQVPVIATTPAGQVTFAYTQGDASGGALDRDIAVANAGGGTLTGLATTVTYAPGQSTGWLLNDQAPLAGGTAPTTLAVRVRAAALLPGTYDATIRITSTLAGVVPLDLPVRLTVTSGGARLGLSPDSISARSWSNGPTVRAAVDVVELNGVGEAALGAITCGAPRYVEGAGWATIVRCSDSVVVSLNPGNNFNGTDRATIEVRSAFTTDVVVLRLRLTAFPPTLEFTPTQLTVQSQQNGSSFRVAAAVQVGVLAGSPTPYPTGSVGALVCGVSAPAGAPPMTIARCGPDSVAVSVTPNSATGTFRYIVTADAPSSSPRVQGGGYVVDVNFVAAPPPPPPSTPFRALIVSGTCAFGVDELLYCWGANTNGQLGDGTTVRKNRPNRVTVQAGGRLLNLDMGGDVNCAAGFGTLTEGVYCWGRNTSGTTGLGTLLGNTLVPTRLNFGGVNFQNVGVGSQTACATTVESGVTPVYCWGSNQFGQVGVGSTTAFFELPQRVNVPEPDVGEVAVGGNHVCVLGAQAPYQLYCWGQGWYLGNGTTSGSVRRNTPLLIPFPDDLPSGGIVAGDEATCVANFASSRLYCWGPNSNGEVGNGTQNIVAVPTQVVFPGGIGVSDYTMGSTHACAISGGATYCWGSNRFGQLGNGTTTDALSPVRIANDPGFSSVRAVGFTTCGIVQADNRVMCWGFGLTGEIGNGQENNVNVPTQVIAP